MSSCQKYCVGGRQYVLPRHQLDPGRRKLEFSEVSESDHPKPPPAAPDRYGSFKKVAEKHSSHEILKPMYTSAELASVPQSFLDLFRSRLGEEAPSPQPRKKVRAPPRTPEEEIEIPASFLEFCQERLANRTRSLSPKAPSVSGSASPRSGISYQSEDSYYVPGPSPRETSYYGGAMPRPPYPGRSPTAPSGSRPRSRSKKMNYGSYEYPVRPTTSPPYGIGKFAYPSSNCSPTPPTPSFACPGANALTSYTMETSISSGDLEDSPKHKSRARRSRYSTCDESVNTSSPGYPLAQSTPHNPLLNYMRPNISDSLSPRRPAPKNLMVNYLKPNVREGASSLSVRKRDMSDLVDTDDLIQSSNCPGCPTLGVTPVQSSLSLSPPSAENVSANNKQNISKSIEHELLAREAQERSQLEADLLRWQHARRKLVMNTASMGS